MTDIGGGASQLEPEGSLSLRPGGPLGPAGSTVRAIALPSMSSAVMGQFSSKNARWSLSGGRLQLSIQ